MHVTAQYIHATVRNSRPGTPVADGYQENQLIECVVLMTLTWYCSLLLHTFEVKLMHELNLAVEKLSGF